MHQPFTFVHRHHIVEHVEGLRLPTMYGSGEAVKVGGLMSYAVSVADAFRRGAIFVDKVLRMVTSRLLVVGILLVAVFLRMGNVGAAQPRIFQVGIVHLGGPYSPAIEGLRDGLRELGLEDGKQFVLHVRDAEGDPKSLETAARTLEEQKVDLIVAMTTSVTLAVKRATKRVPIIFYAGTDPVSNGLVQAFGRPGGRLTGIHSQSGSLTAKRLELLKELLPSLRRVVTFYRPNNAPAQFSVKIARDAARRLKVDLIERPVTSVDELRAALQALRPGEADAVLSVADAMVNSNIEVVIENAREKRLATMAQERWAVVKGALISYGESFYTIGRLSARHVHRVVMGADPATLPVEQVDRFHLVVNRSTAKALGLTITPSVLARADEVIE